MSHILCFVFVLLNLVEETLLLYCLSHHLKVKPKSHLRLSQEIKYNTNKSETPTELFSLMSAIGLPLTHFLYSAPQRVPIRCEKGTAMMQICGFSSSFISWRDWSTTSQTWDLSGKLWKDEASEGGSRSLRNRQIHKSTFSSCHRYSPETNWMPERGPDL